MTCDALINAKSVSMKAVEKALIFAATFVVEGGATLPKVRNGKIVDDVPGTKIRTYGKLANLGSMYLKRLHDYEGTNDDDDGESDQNDEECVRSQSVIRHANQQASRRMGGK